MCVATAGQEPCRSLYASCMFAIGKVRRVQSKGSTNFMRIQQPVMDWIFNATLLHGSAAGRIQPPASHFHVRRTYSGRPSSSMRFSEATAMATSVVCRPSVRERSASPITRL